MFSINDNFLIFNLKLDLGTQKRQKNTIFTYDDPLIIRWDFKIPKYSQYFKIDSPKMEFSLCFVLCALSFNSQEKINSSIHFSKFRFLAFAKSGKMTFNCISKCGEKMKIVENKNVEINNFQKYSIAVIGAYRVFYSTWLVIICQKELVNRSQIGLAPLH